MGRNSRIMVPSLASMCVCVTDGALGMVENQNLELESRSISPKADFLLFLGHIDNKILLQWQRNTA